MAADIEGYSRLTAADEEASTQQLQKILSAVRRQIGQAKGKAFTEAGDGILAHFPGPLEAIRCAMEIQRDLNLLNLDVHQASQMHLRIGITVADALVVGSDLYGNNANIAVRIESVTRPGDIMISELAYDLVKRTNTYSFKDMGLFTLKNISEKQRLFKVIGETERTGRLSNISARSNSDIRIVISRTQRTENCCCDSVRIHRQAA